ncbi:MAG: polysaccharide pyruvyl transferase family protein [Candidatus Accumulibacter sp. UW20]|jgi:polysaccharide pyruvyl transferase WcaK-like protein
MQRPSILMHASGFSTGDNDAVNLGDSAQQLRALRLLRQLFPKHRIVAIANSLKDRQPEECDELAAELARYLVGRSGNRSGRLLMGVRAVMLLFTASARRWLGVEWVGNDGRAVLDRVRECDFVFYSGAGALNDKYLRGVAALWLLTALLARVQGKPVVLLGQQVGPLSSPLGRTFFRWSMADVLFLGCRDRESVTLSEEIGLDPQSVQFTGDEGAYLPPAPWSKGLALLQGLGVRPGYVAVHFRLDSNCPFQDSTHWLADVINRIIADASADVLLVPMAYRGANDDRVALQRLSPLLNTSCALLECEDPALAKACLAHASLAVGVANHFIVFAASVGVPSVGIHATEYMRQKLQGAGECFPHVLSVGCKSLDSAALAKAAISMTRAAGECAFPTGYAMELPRGYWAWLDCLAEHGITAERLGSGEA